MTTFLSWVDYSSAERQRMRQAVALFAEKDTRDELGLGSLRDAISDALFPGTSVIQTRLRYALFIAWIYKGLEGRSRIHAGNVSGYARAEELSLIGPLESSDDPAGTIGVVAKTTLKRLPSSVYWLALRRWGIFEQDWSMDDYHRSWDRLRKTKNGQRSADDEGVALEGVTTWNAHLPSPPEDFPGTASFRLTVAEAEFFQERLREHCRGTLFGHCVDAEALARPHLDAPSPFDAFPFELPPRLHEQLALASQFSRLMQGAARMYNLALARRTETFSEKAEYHLEALLEWHEEAQAEQVASWSLDQLWEFAAGRANVTPRTREFIIAWQSLYRELGLGVAESAEVARLVEQREWQLKGSRSRFRNPRALEVWGGESGTARMSYRWGTVRQLLKDFYQGLDGGAD